MKKQIEEMKKDIHTVLLHNCRYDFCEGVLVGFNEEGIARELYDEGYRKQEWISVEERLPAEDVRVLVWLRKDHKTTYTRIDTDRRLNGVWVRWYESVTHWMPLPEPPKGE